MRGYKILNYYKISAILSILVLRYGSNCLPAQSRALLATNPFDAVHATVEAAETFIKLMKEFGTLGMEPCDKAGTFPIKNECHFFRVCSTPKRPYPGRCEAGKQFDHIRRKCLSGRVRCKNVCEVEGKILYDPKSVTGYLECKNGVPVQVPCKEGGYIFDPKKNKCVRGTPPDVEDSEENDKELINLNADDFAE